VTTLELKTGDDRVFVRRRSGRRPPVLLYGLRARTSTEPFPPPKRLSVVGNSHSATGIPLSPNQESVKPFVALSLATNFFPQSFGPQTGEIKVDIWRPSDFAGGGTELPAPALTVTLKRTSTSGPLRVRKKIALTRPDESDA
jgi:hypothetical protein